MADQSLSAEEIELLAERPSAEFDQVVIEADYAARAMLSFYRFRQLGGGIFDSKSSKNLLDDAGNPVDVHNPETEKLSIGQTFAHGIRTVSDHPDNRLFQISIIALLVLFESTVNAYFFAQQSAFGLFGGIFQAAAVSLANVVTSFFIIGYWGLRHASTPVQLFGERWDRRHWFKLFGFIAILFGLIIILLVNLSAAHYRNIIDLVAEGLKPNTEVTSTWPRFLISAETCKTVLEDEAAASSIGSAATSAMCRPFALNSLDAMVLFALGLAIAAIAAYDGRKWDAAYPGLSDAARAVERAREDLQFALEDYEEAVDYLVEDARKIVEGTYREELDEPAALAEDRRRAGYSDFTRRDELALRGALARRVEPYRDLLMSSKDILSDEFAVDLEIVDRIAPFARDSWRRG